MLPKHFASSILASCAKCLDSGIRRFIHAYSLDLSCSLKCLWSLHKEGYCADLVFLYSIYEHIFNRGKKEHRMSNFLWGNKLLVFLGNKESLNP